jgi:beta-phosphoglucomutase-like phosphatase (HAD superfamily)
LRSDHNHPDDETIVSLSAKLDKAGLLKFLDPSLLVLTSVEKKSKKDPAIFLLASTRAKQSPPNCIYVSESEPERTVAEKAGLAVSFHPLHLLALLKRP